MVRASASGAGFDSEPGQTNDLKLVLTASLLDASNIKRTVWKINREVYWLCRWEMHLAGLVW